MKPTAAPIPRLALSVEDAATACGMSRWTLSKEIRDKKIRKTNRGVIPIGEIERYLQSEIKEQTK